MVFFFFSSRRRHTRWTGDWSSDVCSSDLPAAPEGTGVVQAWYCSLLPAPLSQASGPPGKRGNLRGHVRQVGGAGRHLPDPTDQERELAVTGPSGVPTRRAAVVGQRQASPAVIFCCASAIAPFSA